VSTNSAPRSVALAGAGALVLLVGVLGAPAQAASVTVSGWVYRDLDNDGIRDAAEPGVAGIRVHRNSGNGTPTATTDANGHWSLTGITPGASGVLQVETGWFRSQCSGLNCPVGPGPDNDFLTKNQFIQFPLSALTGSRADLSVGLLPDWPGSTSAAPMPVGGAVPANAVDVAARLSWASSTCSDGTLLICRPGDTYTVTGQIHNQGTRALTGLTARLALPGGDGFAAGQSVVLTDAATSPSVTGVTVGAFDPATDSVSLTFTGNLVAGGLIRVTAAVLVGATQGTAGCKRGAPTAACPTGEPQGAPLVLAVTHIDQTGDPDSFGPGCSAVDIRLCPTGIHDKQVEPDEVDPVGHNVDSSLGVDTEYNLSANLDIVAGGAVWRAGSPVTVRASAYNFGPATAAKGWTLTILFPKGSAPAIPTKNALRTCTKGTLASGVINITCTGKGPLSPAVTSLAVDISAKIPTTAKPGSTWQMLAFVAPAAGQSAEVNALGIPPINPATNASTTSTDNDASGSVSIT
jgi:SdrD B-like domain